MNRKKLLGILGAALGLVLVFVWLAGGFVGKVSSDATPSSASTQTRGQTIEWSIVPEKRMFSGSLQARQQANLSARITARVAEVLVDAGDRVEAGDVLLRLESDDLSARVRQQEQALASAQARVNEARLNFQRSEQLVLQGLLPEARLDEVRAQRDSAEAEFNRAREALSEARTSEGFSMIVAPFSGVVSRRAVFTGDTATPGMHLVSLYDPQTLRLEATISESALGFLSIGDRLTVHLDVANRELEAELVEIEPAADAASRSFVVRFALEIDGRLYPGMFGKVSVPVGERQVLLVPSAWVIQRGQLDFIEVNTASGSERRLVRLGDTHLMEGQRMVEIAAGLQPGERVIAQ